MDEPKVKFFPFTPPPPKPPVDEAALVLEANLSAEVLKPWLQGSRRGGRNKVGKMAARRAANR